MSRATVVESEVRELIDALALALDIGRPPEVERVVEALAPFGVDPTALRAEIRMNGSHAAAEWCECGRCECW